MAFDEEIIVKMIEFLAHNERKARKIEGGKTNMAVDCEKSSEKMCGRKKKEKVLLFSLQKFRVCLGVCGMSYAFDVRKKKSKESNEFSSV